MLCIRMTYILMLFFYNFSCILQLQSHIKGFQLCTSFFTTLCSFGCLYQLYQVTHSYLKFEVKTETVISISTNLTPPDITVCTRAMQFINLTKLTEKYPSLTLEIINYDNQFNKANLTDIYKVNETVLNFFIMTRLRLNETAEIMYPPTHLIKSWATSNRVFNSSYGLRKNECRLRGRFKKFHFCITLTCTSMKDEVITESDFAISYNRKPVLAVYLNYEVFKQVSSLIVSLQRYTALPRGDKIKWVILNRHKTVHKYPITFRTFESHLLPPPYTTMCQDYSSVGFDTLEHAREICITNETLSAFGIPFARVLADPNWPYPFGLKLQYLAEKNSTIKQQLFSILEKCFQDTDRPHCDDIYYLTSTKNEQAINESDPYIDLKMPVEPSIKVTYKPKHTSVEYFIAVGSVMGTWLGFNCSSSLPIVISYLSTGLSLHFRKIFKASKIESDKVCPNSHEAIRKSEFQVNSKKNNLWTIRYKDYLFYKAHQMSKNTQQ